MVLAGFICQFLVVSGLAINWQVPYDLTVFAIILDGAGSLSRSPLLAYPTVSSVDYAAVFPAAGSYDVAIDFKAGELITLAPKSIGTLNVSMFHTPPNIGLN